MPDINGRDPDFPLFNIPRPKFPKRPPGFPPPPPPFGPSVDDPINEGFNEEVRRIESAEALLREAHFNLQTISDSLPYGESTYRMDAARHFLTTTRNNVTATIEKFREAQKEWRKYQGGTS
jgi:hypothetical protein